MPLHRDVTRLKNVLIDGAMKIDGEEVETALLLGTGEVVDLNGEANALILDADADTHISAPTDDQIDIALAGVDHVVLKKVAAADSGATTNIVEIAATTPVDTTGTNVHNALNIDLEIGNASGGTNSVNAIAIDNITGDAQVTATGLLVGTGFDIGVDMQGTKLELDADNDTSIIASTDDQIDIEIAGAVDIRMVANILRLLSGTVLETDVINEVTAAAGVTIDSVLLKDGIVGISQVISGDGAITISNKNTVLLTKGSAAALTLAAPTTTTHDFWEVTVISTTAFAHVITGGVRGFNGKGSSGTATAAANKGSTVTFVAYQGDWYVKSNVGFTIA